MELPLIDFSCVTIPLVSCIDFPLKLSGLTLLLIQTKVTKIEGCRLCAQNPCISWFLIASYESDVSKRRTTSNKMAQTIKPIHQDFRAGLPFGVQSNDCMF